MLNNLRFLLSGGRKSDLSSIFRLISPQSFPGIKKIRVGNPDADGGYVMQDGFETIGAALSLGVGTDITWDIQIAGNGIPVYQYDHTVSPPVVNNPLIHFNAFGIAANPAPGSPFKSLDNIITTDLAAYSGDLLLKIDIEGYEWEVFEHLDESLLKRFRQICVEFHSPFGNTTHHSVRARTRRVLEKLGRTHIPIHVHGNNAAGLKLICGLQVPRLLEISYVRKDELAYFPSEEILPSHLDVPNIRNIPDIPITELIKTAQ